MDLRSIKEWADRMERRVSELEAKGQISEQRIDELSDVYGKRLDMHADRISGAEAELRLHVKRLDAIAEGEQDQERRISALEGYHVQPPPQPVPDLTKYEEIANALIQKHADDWHTLSSVGHDYARHIVDGYHWMHGATGVSMYRHSAEAHANRVLDAVLARDRNLDDLRLVSGFRLLGDEEIDERVTNVVYRCLGIRMHPSISFTHWAREQHRYTFSWSPPQGEWQGVCGYYARSTVDTNARARVLDAFRECVERGAPGVYGADWEALYRGARSSFKAGRDVRLLEIDESLRPIFVNIWGSISHVAANPASVPMHIDGHGPEVGVPLFDGWNYIVPTDLMDRVLDDVMAGRSNKMSDLNTHPTGVRQLALCGATALRRAKG